MDQKVKQPNVFKRAFAKRGMGQVVTVFFGLIVLCLVFNIVNPNFLGERNVANLLQAVRAVPHRGHRPVVRAHHRQHRPVHRLGAGHELHDLGPR